MLCLDSLRVCVPVRSDIVALEADKVNKFLVELFVKHASDTFIVSQVGGILGVLRRRGRGWYTEVITEGGEGVVY